MPPVMMEPPAEAVIVERPSRAVSEPREESADREERPERVMSCALATRTWRATKARALRWCMVAVMAGWRSVGGSDVEVI